VKKSVIVCLLAVSAVVFGFGNAFANPEGVCPEGKLIGHLKIIGVPSDKNVNMEGKGVGSVIFVDLGEDGDAATTEISLIQGDDFAVVDKNGTDGDAAFMLPPTGLDPYIIGGDMTDVNTHSLYSVFIRALGTPGGKATITTCADIAVAFEEWISKKTAKILTNIDPSEGETVCSLEQVTNDILVRTRSKPKFINVTAELLTIVFEVTIEDDTSVETFNVRVPIFSDLLEGEYWQYDNEGLKNLDVRFYDCSTDVSEGDDAF
jgi:hypothetical protein